MIFKLFLKTHQNFIEDVLYELDEVKEAAVIGVEDHILGQAIKAFVVSQTGKTLTESKVKKYCMMNLESFAVSKFVEFRKNLPKSPHGKTDKKKLS